ncbi:MAG: hypothetical protein GX638_15905 [Crenarchaeota archaeon]|nr:hypothetical protein [Thermoproteota archaeon]
MQVKPSEIDDDQLRDLLVQVVLEWEKRFAVAPRITADIAEYDAAKLVNTTLRIGEGRKKTDNATTKGYDFLGADNLRYQVKARRPGPHGKVRRVPKAKNYDWDKLIWICYDGNFVTQEAWMFEVEVYKSLFESKPRLTPQDMRKGTRLWPMPIIS